MRIQINTDNNIDSGDQLTRLVTDDLETAFGADARRINRVDVHFGDESAGRSTGDDMRCMIEVFPAGHGPVAVTAHSATTDQALRDAVEKMHHLLESLFGKLDDRHPGAPSVTRG